jgi:hypothetical protein
MCDRTDRQFRRSVPFPIQDRIPYVNITDLRQMDVAVWMWGQMDVKKNIYRSVNKINKLFIFIIICKF